MHLKTRFEEILNKNSRTLIGLMSGMSMDGVDLACIRVSGEFPDLKVELLGTHFRGYSDKIRARLLQGREGYVGDIAKLNFVVAEEFSHCVKEFFDKSHFTKEHIDAIGSHGQTVFHEAEDNEVFTLQLGSPSIIAEKTEIPTIGNFRLRDLVVGGKGAPLVPLADYILHRECTEVVILNNLGSISNVTVVTPKVEDMLAFDTGPANMPIDFYIRELGENVQKIDRNGEVSAKGNSIPQMLAKMLALPFFAKAPPKAAGYHEFGPKFLGELLLSFPGYPLEDYVRTAVEFSARTLADAYKKFVIPKFSQIQKIQFSGGGVYNKTLMRRISDHLPGIEIATFSSEFSDAKEAIAFALLANETLSGRAGNIAGATGASKPVVLGEIAF